jgi:adenylate kinase family enzyme
MKEKILILGRPGSGKSDLARRLARSLNYDLVDEVTDAWWIFVNRKPKTVYVSNSITHAEADMRLSDFTVITLYNI